MPENKKDGSLNIPIFKIINEEFQEDFSKAKNILGASELSFGLKKTVIKKLYGITTDTTMKMLAGKIGHKMIQYEPIRTKIVEHINDELDIKGKPVSKKEKSIKYKIAPGKFLRMHPDILTPDYPIEIKFTAMPLRQWERKVAVYHLAQLNTYAGYHKRDRGVLMVINLYVFVSGSKNWDYIMNNFTFTLPFDTDYNQYKKTIETAKLLFKHIDAEDFKDLPCPNYSWECSKCMKETMEICGKVKYKCQEYDDLKGKKCYKEMIHYPDKLTAKFLDSPMCEKHFLEAYPHSKYIKYKFKDYKKMMK